LSCSEFPNTSICKYSLQVGYILNNKREYKTPFPYLTLKQKAHNLGRGKYELMQIYKKNDPLAVLMVCKTGTVGANIQKKSSTGILLL